MRLSSYQARLASVAADGRQDRWTKTDYDGFYHLFPVKVYDGVRPEFAETASYYGVNAVSSGESKGWGDSWHYWGAMAEWWDVNDVCARQAYDSHGRRTLAWENVARGAGWGSLTASNAAVNWSYRDPLNNAGDDKLTVTEWRNPRCAGNFVHRRYDGLGQLVQEQRPGQNWVIAGTGCTAAPTPLPEIDIDYIYDGLGRQYAASVPHPANGDWLTRGANWNYGSTLMAYDALGRVTETRAPNGERTTYSYSGRQAKVMGVGRNGYGNRTLRWTETDGLGNLAYVRTGDGNGVELSRVTLAHDVLGNLVQVTHPGGKLTTMVYDLGGRKVEMNDPDLGLWSYDYNRQGQLLNQVDACGNATALSYDGLGRLVEARYGAIGACAAGSRGVWLTHHYYPWLSGDGNGNGRYRGLDVGGTPGGWNIATTWYSYDTYGNPVAHVGTTNLTEHTRTTFSYDGQNRVTGGFGESFTWQSRGALAKFNGATLTYDLEHIHAVNKLAGVDRYDYDRNGNMTVRNKGLGWNQRMTWDSRNRLAQMSGAGVSESYLYDAGGARIRKTNLLGNTSTFYPVARYEQTSCGVVTKHYSFNGVPVAVRDGSGLFFLYQDGVSSNVYVTDAWGSVGASRGYLAFGPPT